MTFPSDLDLTLPANLVKLIPDRSFDLRAVTDEDVAVSAIEASYDAEGGDAFVGCFIDDEECPEWERRLARYCKDSFFADTPGKKEFSSAVSDFDPIPPLNGVEGRYVFTSYAMEALEAEGKHKDTSKGIYRIRQNYGDCVDASGMYGDDYIGGVLWKLGLLSFPYQAAFYAYSLRGYCRDGWQMAKRAKVAKSVGWLPAAEMRVGDREINFDREDESEKVMARGWCGSGPPKWLMEWTRDNFMWDSAAVTWFDHDRSQNALKDLFMRGGYFHHGSNRTSRTPRPNDLKGIGGHAQPALGGDWSDECLRWFRDNHNVRYDESDFPCVQGQQWGTTWNGALSERYWFPGWGPFIPGCWLISSKQLLSGSFSGTCYLPKRDGFAPDSPPNPPKPPTPAGLLRGELYGELTSSGRIVIQGEIIDPAGDSHIAVPIGEGRYKLVPKPVL